MKAIIAPLYFPYIPGNLQPFFYSVDTVLAAGRKSVSEHQNCCKAWSSRKPLTVTAGLDLWQVSSTACRHKNSRSAGSDLLLNTNAACMYSASATRQLVLARQTQQLSHGLFVCSVFNGTFTTNRLYRAITVSQIKRSKYQKIHAIKNTTVKITRTRTAQE